MKLAIMQPYFLPYIGYFQLIRAVDKFVLYDDVNFINRGWINRNNLLVNGKANMFTIPLADASQNKLIFEIQVLAEDGWRTRLLKTIQQSYSKAPMFGTVWPLISDIICYKPAHISDYCYYSLKQICSYLHIPTTLSPTSTGYQNTRLKSQDRILDICRQEEAEVYINPSGGAALYDKDVFASQGLSLYFLRSGLIPYPQFRNEFVPGLSIADVLMFNDIPSIHQLLDACELV